MNKKFFAALASATMAFTASGSIAVFADDFVEEKNPVINNGQVTRRNIMNKKFFAALASATMAFTASGSIAVFADDFVEEKNPVINNGQVTPKPTKVLWNQENFGDLATKKGDVNPAVTGLDTVKPDEKGYVETKTLEAVTNIQLSTNFKGEIKGLEYFTGLTSFYDTYATAVTNTKLDFSANKVLNTLSVSKAADLTEIVLPEPVVTEKDGKEEVTYSLNSLTLSGTALTTLDLSAQDALTYITVTGNSNLKEVKLQQGTSRTHSAYGTVDLSKNNLDTVDFTNVDFYDLNLGDNHIGALDLSNTTVTGTATLYPQTFYVSETLKNVNLAETFENFDKTAVSTNHEYDEKTGVLTIDGGDAYYHYNTGVKNDNVNLAETFENFDKTAVSTNHEYDEKTGVLTIDGGDAYYHYNTGVKNDNQYLTVTLKAANPMNRLYNPNSGEHFYTADIEEKAALVNLGWNDEGYGWVAPQAKDSTVPVYRVYNPNAGDHHYTMNKGERDTLVAYGWKDEGIGWYSDTNKTVPVYRQYNPYANGAGAHNYTTDKAENDHLVSLGWTPEGKAWYAVQ